MNTNHSATINLTKTETGKEIFLALQKAYYEKEAVDNIVKNVSSADIKNSEYNKYIVDAQIEKGVEYSKSQTAVTSFLMNATKLSNFDWKIMDMHVGTLMIQYTDAEEIKATEEFEAMLV